MGRGMSHTDGFPAKQQEQIPHIIASLSIKLKCQSLQGRLVGQTDKNTKDMTNTVLPLCKEGSKQ